MDRMMVYPGAIPLETDILNTERSVMIGLGYALQGYLGTGTYVDGFTCVQTTVASQSVQVTPGSIMTLGNVDNTAFSSLAADTTQQIIKQGLSLNTQTFTCAAPTTVGYSVAYLVEVAQADVDGAPVVLPYFNPSAPSVAWSGPGGAGTTNNTVRQSQAVLVLKTGIAATTGTQVTPTPDAGYVGMFVITVAYGQTTITSTSIANYSPSSFIPVKLPQILGLIRTRLTANTNFFVNASTGNDTTGSGTASAPWQTLQKAWNSIQQNIDLAGNGVAINCTGAFTAGMTANGPLVGSGSAIFSFASGSSVAATNNNAFTAQYGAAFTIQGTGTPVLLTTSGTGGGLGYGIAAVYGGSTITVGAGVNFGTCFAGHVYANGGSVSLFNAYTISGSTPTHVSIAGGGGYITTSQPGGQTVTLTGTPNFSTAFAYTAAPGNIALGNITFTGSATGVRYSANQGGTIQTGGGGVSYLPGSSAGTTSTGGQYS